MRNPYDDAILFEKYSQMPRSQRGLDAAGEWPALRALLPDFSGRRVLDLGCGYGWHCRYAAENGASQVTGIDLSRRMLDVARAMGGSARIRYERAAMEELRFEQDSFDIVLSSLAFHYIEPFAPLVRRIFDWLSPGGSLIFSCEHPVFTAQGPQDWIYDADGEIAHFPVDRYFDEGPRESVFLGETVVKYHRTLTSILGAVTAAGFSLRQVVEPQPPASLLDQPGMRDELRRPMMLLVAADKHV